MNRKRWAGVAIGAAVMIVATAVFRYGLTDDEVSILGLVAFVAGLGMAFGSVLGVPGWRPAPPTEGGPDLWDRTGAWLAEVGVIPALLILTGIVAAVHAPVFRGEPYGDDLTFHMAESKRIADCLASGDWDFWNASANGGYASAYYYQVIPQLASAIPSAIFGHHLFWFQLSIWLPLTIGPLAAYRGMRMIGFTPWQSFAGAACACLMNGESRWGSGNAGTFQVGLYTQTWALAIFPLALGHGVRWVRDRKSLAPAIAWGTFVGLCHPFAGISLGLALFIGVPGVLISLLELSAQVRRALRMLTPPPSLRKIAAIVVGALLVLVGIFMFVLVSTDLELGGLEALRGTTPNDISLGLYFMPLMPIVAGVVMIVRGVQAPIPDPIDDAQARDDARRRAAQFGRLAILGACLVVATLPGWITLLVDYKGFGGFPHRVNDEVGPGLVGLLVGRTDPNFKGFFTGDILDFNFGAHVLTIAMPIALIFARDKLLRYLWLPAALFVVFLAAGPHLGTTEDDLFPMVRFLGALQICLGLATGAGLVWIGSWLANRPEDSRLVARIHFFPPKQVVYGLRTVVAALAAAGTVLLVAGGAGALAARVNVLERSNPARIQMMEIIAKLRELPQGAKQVGPGCENHWWNLLSYVYSGRPSMLQMGGGGLQASPNYDALWNDHEPRKTAWLFNAPYYVVEKNNDEQMKMVGDTIFSTESYHLKKLPSTGYVSPVDIFATLPSNKKAAHKEMLAWLATDGPVTDTVKSYAEVPRHVPSGQIISSHMQASPGDDPDVVAKVHVDRETYFMLRQSWHPRWHAYADGNELPIIRVTPDFPAVLVPAGDHELAFRFERPWWATSSWLMWPLVVLVAWRLTREKSMFASARLVGRGDSRRPETAS